MSFKLLYIKLKSGKIFFRISYTCIFLFSILISCNKDEFNIENLHGNKIIALGHAGMGVSSTYPMNSLESITKCLNLGMDGSEFDVQMTKDSVLVAYHDQNLSDRTNFAGMINSYTWDELKNTKYNQTPYLNYQLCSIEDIFMSISNPENYYFTFDCKSFPANIEKEKYNNLFANAILRLVNKYPVAKNLCIESQDPDFLKIMKAKNNEIKLFIYPENFESGLQSVLENGFAGITISTRNITKEQIRRAHQNNIFVAIWNTHSKSDNREAIEKNPDYIQTDNLGNLLKLLK